MKILNHIACTLKLVDTEHGMYMDVVTYTSMFIPYLHIIFCVKFAYFQMPYSKIFLQAQIIC
jgi:hypothetical protein